MAGEDLVEIKVGGHDAVKAPYYPQVPQYDEDLKFANIGEAIDVFVKTRDDLAAFRKEYNQYEANAKNYMERIQGWIRDKADELGVDSFKTQFGTAYRTVKDSYRVGLWDDFVEWIKQTGNFHCLEKRAAKLAVKEIHNETGECPPGLEHHVEVEFDIRRPSK